MDFFAYREFWLPVVLVSAATAAATGAGGVHLLLRRAVFLPAALTQVSALGVVLAFLLGHRLGGGPGDWLWNPLLWAALLGGLFSMFIARQTGPGIFGRDWGLATALVLAWAGVLGLGSLVPEESHEIQGLLAGSGVALGAGEALAPALVAALVLLFLLGLARPLLAVAFDREAASLAGLPVAWLEAGLFFLVGVAVAASTKVSGALASFAFSIFPAALALRLVGSPWWTVPTAALLGALAAFFGYWLAFETGLPAGASMAGVAGLGALAGVIAGRSRRAPGPARQRADRQP